MRWKLGAVVAAGSLVAAVAVGMAQEKATGIVAYRQGVMKANAGHAQALQVALTDQTQLVGEAAYHAEAMKEGFEYLPDLFPAGSTAVSRALPAVWDDRAGFEAAAKKAEELAGALVEALQSGDTAASLAAFQALGKDGCGGCHNTYRQKQS